VPPEGGIKWSVWCRGERLCGVIEPHYPQGKRGRRPVGIERMLRIYFLQQWYALAD
jgi:transposase, IS5 family